MALNSQFTGLYLLVQLCSTMSGLCAVMDVTQGFVHDRQGFYRLTYIFNCF